MIKNIIFDLCGPVITIDLDLIDQRFHALGVGAEKPYDLLVDSGLTERFESDEISSRVFFDEVRRLLNCTLSDEEITDFWNTLITAFPMSHVELLKGVRNHYRTFLLSNSDEINALFFKEELGRRAGFDFTGQCFEEAFFSHAIGCRKPSLQAFSHILNKYQLNPEETLMIDDREGHCEGARKAGLKALRLDPDTDLTQLFDEDFKLKND